MSLIKAIYEHLKTYKKYNALLVKYDNKCQEYDNKVIELNTQKRIRQIEKNKWEDMLKSYVGENIILRAKLQKKRHKKGE